MKVKLKEVLQIPSYSVHEQRVIKYIVNWAKANGYEYSFDDMFNVFVKKGVIAEGEAYPCVVAHMDTVHSDQIDMIEDDELLNIKEGRNSEGEKVLYATRTIQSSGIQINTGIGGDDKAGVYIAMKIIEETDVIMGAFFVEEETGCDGSAFAKDNEWLKECGYFIQFDAPTDNWVSKSCYGIKLFNDTFADLLKPVWDRYKLTNISNDPYTDVKELRLNYPVNCINYFAGYENMHTKYEYVVVPHVNKAVRVGKSTIKKLGKKTYLY